MNDTVQVDGLEVLLDDDDLPPYLSLRMRCNDREFQSVILAVEQEWALNIRDERGVSCVGDGELYGTQASAILAAMLTVLETSRNPALW